MTSCARGFQEFGVHFRPDTGRRDSVIGGTDGAVDVDEFGIAAWGRESRMAVD